MIGAEPQLERPRAGPFTFDVDDYCALRDDERARFDAWLCDAVGVDNVRELHCWAVELVGEGVVRLHCYCLDEEGKPFRLLDPDEHGGRDIATYTQDIAAGLPPVWKSATEEGGW